MHTVLLHIFHLLPIDLSLRIGYIDAMYRVFIWYPDIEAFIGTIVRFFAYVSYPAPGGGKCFYNISIVKWG